MTTLNKQLSLFGLIGVMVLLTGCPGSPAWRAMQRKRAHNKYMNHPPKELYPYYRDVVGKVGHHLSAGPKAKCSGSWRGNATLVSGSMPPGLNFSNGRITGTPQQPGRWEFTVQFYGLNCTVKGVKKTYPNYNRRTAIQINGYSPGRVD